MQCCHADAPLGRTQRGDGGQSPPLPGRTCHLAFGVWEFPLPGAVAVCRPTRSGRCVSRSSRRGAGRAARRTTNIRRDPRQDPDLVLKLCRTFCPIRSRRRRRSLHCREIVSWRGSDDARHSPWGAASPGLRHLLPGISALTGRAVGAVRCAGRHKLRHVQFSGSDAAHCESCFLSVGL